MKIILCFALLTLLSACDENKTSLPQVNDQKLGMLDADRAFSAMSQQQGMKNAYLEFIDSNGVLLRPGMLPVKGADAIDFLLQVNDSDYTFTWEPKDGIIAQSGDMGYTYGVYQLRPKDKDTTLFGTYVSIWKKQADGKWKFVLDSGNDGIGDYSQFDPATKDSL